MRYLRHIEACNPPVDEVFLPWRVDGLVVGWVRPRFVRELRRFPAVFTFADDRELGLVAGLQDFESRSAALERSRVGPPGLARLIR